MPINRGKKRIADSMSFLPKFSDPDIFKSVLRSEYWKHLFMGDPKALWIGLKAITALKVDMFANPLKSVLRIDHGKRTIGLTMTSLSALMMIAFNTTYMVGYLATIMPLTAPFIPLYMSGEEIFDASFIAIRSEALLYTWIGYLGLMSIHLIRMYFGWGSPSSGSERGRPILHVLLLKRFGITATQTRHLVEPVLVGGIGAWLWWSGTDMIFGLFLILCAASVFFQESYDAIMRFVTSS